MKIKRTILQVEVLHDEELDIPTLKLRDVAYHIDNTPGLVGKVSVVSTEEVPYEKVWGAVAAMGQDPMLMQPGVGS